jgi:hypothetical protein
MKCNICNSGIPPLYQHHSLPAWICHTCKALGRMIESAFSPDSVEPEMPAPEIEAPKPAEAVQESVPASPSDQEPTVSTESEQAAATEPEPEADQTDSKRKTKKLK